MEKGKQELRQLPTRESKSVFLRYGGGKPLQAALNEKLYNRMIAEQEHFKEWLFTQPKDAILNRAEEYGTREDIIYSLEENSLSIEQAQALLRSPCPLDDIYKDLSKQETDYMGMVFDTVRSRADQDIQREKERDEAR